MNLERVPPSAESLAILKPAIDKGHRDPMLVRDRILSGRYQCWRVSDGAGGYIVTSVGWTVGDRKRALWVVYAAGHVDGGPKARLAAMRGLMARIEHMGWMDGCKEVRVEEARWTRVLDGYDVLPKDGGGTVLRKVLDG